MIDRYREVAITIMGILLIMTATTPLGIETDTTNTEPTETDPLDGPAVTMFRDGLPYAFMISWDDGSNDWEFSLLEDRLGMKHTSFLVTSRIQNRQLWGLDMLFRGHDIQSHAREHKALRLVNESYRRYLMEQSIVDVQDVYGLTPVMLAYPYGSADEETSAMALEYFDVARGITAEKLIGTWPIARPGNARHSTFSNGGLHGGNIEMLVDRFLHMTQKGAGRAFKIYGHTSIGYFSLEERSTFYHELERVAYRDDTWYTSWGEAVSYQIVRDGTFFTELHQRPRLVSFKVDTTADINRHPIPVTVRVETPQWENITVIDEGRVVPFIIDGNYIMFDVLPTGQTVRVISERSYERTYDETRPIIEDIRLLRTSEGTAVLAEIYDTDGAVIDVNMTVFTMDGTHFFTDVFNPLYWGNDTYGCVIMNYHGELVVEIDVRSTGGVVTVIDYF